MNSARSATDSRKVKKAPTAAKPALRLEWVDPGTLAENPDNWRTHPTGQMAALGQVLADPEIGWAGVLLFNEKTGRLIDGHARRKAAIARGDKAVPVVIGNWSAEAERKILLTLDPLAGMATADTSKLQELLDEVTFESEELNSLADGLAKMLQTDAPEESQEKGGEGSGSGSGETTAGARWKIIIDCRTEKEQLRFLKRFTGEGLSCKALTI